MTKATNKLNSALTVTATLADLIPDDSAGRVVWIEKYGPVVGREATEVRLTAPAEGWIAVGMDIDTDGTATYFWSGSAVRGVSAKAGGDVTSAVARFLAARVAEDGALAGEYDASPIIADLQQRALEKKAAEEKAYAERREREAEIERKRIARDAEEAKEKAARLAEMAEWIAAYGSARLKRCVAEGIECETAYRDERLAAERPGWEWDTCGKEREARNPTDAAFELLDRARETAPDAKISFMVLEFEEDDEGETPETWRGCVAKARFLDRDIVFGRP